MKQTGSYQGYKLRQYWVRDGCISPNAWSFDLRNSTKFSISMPGFATSLSTIIVSGMHSFFVDSSYVLSVNRDVTRREHPEALRPLLHEIKEFSKHNHFNVLHPILRQPHTHAVAENDLLIKLLSGLLHAASSYQKIH
jgi:hypothetical protein